MKKRKGRYSFAKLRSERRAPLVVFFACALSGCGAPGEPQPPSPPIPAAITDLSAHQQGNGVQLVFTVPGRTTNGDRLAEVPATEIFRGSLKADGRPDNKSFRLVYTIPGAMADTYAAQGKLHFIDPVSPEELRAHPGLQLAYRVRTRASKKKDSADSNTVTVKLYGVADKIAAVTANVTQNAIELSWAAPKVASANGSENPAAYHVYRGELEPSAPLPTGGDLSQTKWKNLPLLLAQAQSNWYSDTSFEFGKTYIYLVRSVTLAEGKPIESDDSAPAIVTARDTFPPAAPQNAVAVVLPGADSGRVVELSWSINAEADLAGYRVYRSEKQGERGKLLQEELLQSPAYRDLSVEAGHRYWYSIMAVDGAGNESGPSDEVPVDLTQPLP